MGGADKLLLAGSASGFGDGRLDPDFAATLDPQLRDALDHPLRREILRALSAEKGARSIAEIRVALAPFSAGEVNYHVQVLSRRGAVELEGEHPTLGGRQRFYSSEVAGDPQVKWVLRATEEEDRGRRQAGAGERSAGFLTMFRIPRPARTIRLGDRRGRGEEGGR